LVVAGLVAAGLAGIEAPDGFDAVPGLAVAAVPALGLVVDDAVPAGWGVPVAVDGFVVGVVWAPRGNAAKPRARTDSAAKARLGRWVPVGAMVSTSGQESGVG
jgi:hypothetical protein